MLRETWKRWQGEDSLHEMAFGEPVDEVAIKERGLWLTDKARTAKGLREASLIESELLWLSMRRSTDRMPYVVKAVGVPQGPLWITAPTQEGKRILSKRREDAATFTTRVDAQAGMSQVNRAELPPELAPVVFYIVDA